MAIQFLNTGNFPDDAQLTFGNSSDLKIYHDAGASTYMENTSGDWYIMQRTDNGNMVFQCDDGDNGDATYFSLDGGSAEHSGAEITALYTKFPDKSRIALGTDKDLQLYHDGSNSYIRDTGAGSLFVHGDNIYFRKDDFVDYMASFVADGAVSLYYDNSLKFETTNTGIDVTGEGNFTGSGSFTKATSGNSFVLTATDSNDNQPLEVVGTRSDENGPMISIYHNQGSGNATDGDLSTLRFNALNSADEKTLYSKIGFRANDVTDGTEDGAIIFETKANGSEILQLTLDTTSGAARATFEGNITGVTETLTGTESLMLTLNPTANNYGGIWFKYDGTSKGMSVYNSDHMVYGGESGVGTKLQTGGQTALTIDTSKNVTFEQSADSTRSANSIKHASNDFLYVLGGTAGISLSDDGEDTRMILFNSGNVRFDAGTLDEALVITADTGDADFAGAVTIDSITEIGSDTDKFLMSDSGTVKYVSGANLKTYIGASGPDGSGTGNTIAKWSDSDTLTDSSMTDDGSDITATVDGFYIESGSLKIQTSDNTSGKIYLGKTSGTQASSLIDASHSLEIDAATYTGTGQLLLRIDSVTKATIDSSGVTLNDDTEVQGALEVTGSTVKITNAAFPSLEIGAGGLYKIIKDTSVGNTLEIYSGALTPTIEMSTTGATTFSSDVTGNTGFYPDSDGGAEVGNSSLKFSGVYTDLLDAENIKVNGGQGSDGQVLTSTGSGVAWETPSGGGGGSSQWTTIGSNIYYNTGNVGINLSYPKARLHVEGTIKQTSINASEQGLFTSESDPYMKVAGYGKGSFAGAAGADNVVSTYAGFTTAGKLVEPRVSSIVKISPNSWGAQNAGNGTNQVRLTNKSADGVIIPMSVTVRLNQTSPLASSGSWGSEDYPIQLIMYGGGIAGRDKAWTVIGGIPKEILEDTTTNNKYYKIPFDYPAVGYNTGPNNHWWNNSGSSSYTDPGYSNNLAFILQGTTGIKNNSSLGDIYAHVEYVPVNVNAWDTHFNRATKSQYYGYNTNAVRSFYMSNNQQSGICSAQSAPANNIKYWSNGRKLFPQVGDLIYQSNADGTPNFTNAGKAYNGYYYLYSSGGKRYYLRIYSTPAGSKPGVVTLSTSCNIPPPTS